MITAVHHARGLWELAMCNSIVGFSETLECLTSLLTAQANAARPQEAAYGAPGACAPLDQGPRAAAGQAALLHHAHPPQAIHPDQQAQM